MKHDYVELRNHYLPNDISIVFVLESPPAGHGYFYDPSGRVSEVLFRAFMKLMQYTPLDKDEGLREFARRGYVLIDPIYTPVNKLPDREADKLILDNYQNFLADLDNLLDDKRDTPIILVKSNIVRLLEKPLVSDGYNVLNKGILVPFPLHYHMQAFEDRVRSLIHTTHATDN